MKLAEAQFLLSPREYTEMSPCRGIWRQLQTEFRILFNWDKMFLELHYLQNISDTKLKTCLKVINAGCCSAVSDSWPPHGLQHTRLPCPSPSPGLCSNSCPLSQWCHPAISPSVVPFSSFLSLSQHQGLFQSVGSSHQVAKVLELQLQRFQWTFRIDFL